MPCWHDPQRVVAEYASDAIRELDTAPANPTEAHREWVVRHKARSFAEIATLRIVAHNDAGNHHRAAAQLGLSHVGLGKWLRHRGLVP